MLGVQKIKLNKGTVPNQLGLVRGGLVYKNNSTESNQTKAVQFDSIRFVVYLIRLKLNTCRSLVVKYICVVHFAIRSLHQFMFGANDFSTPFILLIIVVEVIFDVISTQYVS